MEKRFRTWKSFIDALSVGLNDLEISASLGITTEEVEQLRIHLAQMDGVMTDFMGLEERRKIARKRLGLDELS